MSWKPEDTHRALQRLTKWRMVFTGWFLGTKPITDEQARAYRDLTDARLLMRAEISALTAVLIDKGIITEEEFSRQLLKEANHYHELLCKKFPGFEATDEGVKIDARLAAETSRNWPK